MTRPPTENKPPAIPLRYRKRHTVHFWGCDYSIQPEVACGHLGDGKVLLQFQPADTRPDYYLIRVDSSWGKGHPDGEFPEDEYDAIEDVIDALEEEFSERERERERLGEELRERGIRPTAANTDLAGNEDRLGWPVLSLDSGYTWGVVARWDGKCWRKAS